MSIGAAFVAVVRTPGIVVAVVVALDNVAATVAIVEGGGGDVAGFGVSASGAGMGFVEAVAPAVVPAGERACCGSWDAGNGERLKTSLAGGVRVAAFFVGCIEVSVPPWVFHATG